MARRSTFAFSLLCLFAAAFSSAAGTEKLPLLKEEVAANRILNQASDFEQPEGKAWRFSDWPPRPKTSDRLIARTIYFSRDQVHAGQWAVCFDLGTAGADRVLGLQQRLKVTKLAPFDGRQVRLSAWVRLVEGPPAYGGRLVMRQWGKPGTPPLAAPSIRIQVVKGKWQYFEHTFPLRLGQTQRADLSVWFRSTPPGQPAPVCYVDDVRLEGLNDPPLEVALLAGKTLLKPERTIPFRVRVLQEIWDEGSRWLRWDVTGPDGALSYKHGAILISKPDFIGEVDLPALADGVYGLRLALGSRPGERTYEKLETFRAATGPFAR